MFHMYHIPHVTGGSRFTKAILNPRTEYKNNEINQVKLAKNYNLQHKSSTLSMALPSSLLSLAHGWLVRATKSSKVKYITPTLQNVF